MKNKPQVSFCIPTLNRPAHILQTVESICSSNILADKFEICIYNNCSEKAYYDLEMLIEKYSNIFQISYVRGSSRLDIDKSMFTVINMAKGDYLFLLGDDDFLLTGGINQVIEIVNNRKFDFALFNGIIFNEKNHTQTRMFKSVEQIYCQDLIFFLLSFKNHCSYGNILIKKEYLNNDKFSYLFGSSHAYGCFWLSFFEMFENDKHPIFLIPKEPIVCLRAVGKTYNILQVTFEHALLEFKLYYNIIGSKSKLILRKYEVAFWKEQSRLINLIKYGLAGNKLKLIKNYNNEFYYNNYGKILFARVLTQCLMPLKEIIKAVYLKYTKGKC